MGCRLNKKAERPTKDQGELNGRLKGLIFEAHVAEVRRVWSRRWVAPKVSRAGRAEWDSTGFRGDQSKETRYTLFRSTTRLEDAACNSNSRHGLRFSRIRIRSWISGPFWHIEIQPLSIAAYFAQIGILASFTLVCRDPSSIYLSNPTFRYLRESCNARHVRSEV